MAKNLGSIVSRVLDTQNRSFNGVVFQQKRPPLDSEMNLSQDISLNQINELTKTLTPSGFLKLGPIRGGELGQLNSFWPNVVILNNPLALVNGWLIKIGSGTNSYPTGASQDVWNLLSGNPEEIALIGPPESSPAEGSYENFIFLEVWQKLLTASDTVYLNGFTQSSLTPVPNDLIDSRIEIETTKRIQVQYRFRWIPTCDFISYRNGLGFPGCFAQGASSAPNSSYTFRQHPSDVGLYIAGDGSLNSQNDLGTVDGFVYAIPVARIHRRNRRAYSITNLNGSSVSMLSGIPSDRPDGLYYDQIAENDIESLRHRISLQGFDTNHLLEENIELLWKRNLPSELKTSTLDANLSGNSLIYVDGISASSAAGVDTRGRIPDGSRRAFIDSRVIQKITWTESSPTLNNGKLWFTPFGYQDQSYEYQLWNEKNFYVSQITPTVIVYDNSTNTRSVIPGGTWQGLGEFRTRSYIDGTLYPNYNKISYTPSNPASIIGKNVAIVFSLISREGGGLDTTNLGSFTNSVDYIYSGHNNLDGKTVECNDYSVPTSSVTLDNPRLSGSFTDFAIKRSIQQFELASQVGSPLRDSYFGAPVKLSYYKVSSGNTTDTIPSSLYGRTVFGISSVLNKTSESYLTPSITKMATGFQISGLVVNTNDVLEYVLLVGDYCVDYIPQSKGISNFAKNFTFSTTISVGQQSGVINIKRINPNFDAVLANAGFYDGINHYYVAYVNNTLIRLASLEGLGTPVIKFNLTAPSAESGSLTLTFLGYYNPAPTDQFYFQYSYVPYKGIINTRLGTTETQDLKILKMDDKLAITSVGTGRVSQSVPKSLNKLTQMLPINNRVLEYNLFGGDLPTPITGGVSSLRRIPIRSLTSVGEEDYLKEGQIVSLAKGQNDLAMARGVIISSPKIIERGINLSPEAPVLPGATGSVSSPNYDPRLDNTSPLYQPVLDPRNAAFDPFYDPALKYNHLTQWAAIVEGLGKLKGELFLMIITTTSTVYNNSEGRIYQYLQEKNLYSDNSLGKASQTLINNNLGSSDLSVNMGAKIYGAVDIFPLLGRPLINPTDLMPRPPSP